MALLNFFQARLGQDEAQPLQHPIKTAALLLKTDWNLTSANRLAISYNFNHSRKENETFDVATYGSSANGMVLSSNYPYQPTGVGASDAMNVAPVYVEGVTVYGTSTGKVIFLDAQNGSAQPALIQMYHFGSAISTIAYDYQSALKSWPRRIAKKLLRRPRYHSPLNPWKEWPSPKVYWDLVAQAAQNAGARGSR